jgi:hypothetical protein
MMDFKGPRGSRVREESISRARFRRQRTRLDGILVEDPYLLPGKIFKVDTVTWIRSARPNLTPKSRCKLGHCRASGGLRPAVLAGVPSGPKAAAAAGHIEPQAEALASSRAQSAPVSAVDYVLIMDACK